MKYLKYLIALAMLLKLIPSGDSKERRPDYDDDDLGRYDDDDYIDIHDKDDDDEENGDYDDDLGR